MDNNPNLTDATLSLPAVQKKNQQNSLNANTAPDNGASGTTAAQPINPTQPAREVSVPSENVSADSSTLVAEDVDLIEKEWVERAKEIVHKTKDNPYLQNRALTQLKVDYVKKRYNKDVQMSE